MEWPCPWACGEYKMECKYVCNGLTNCTEKLPTNQDKRVSAKVVKIRKFKMKYLQK
jgi:hypothetical protein